MIDRTRTDIPPWPAPDVVAALVTRRYDVGPVTGVRQIRVWTNAVYEIRTTSGRYVLKCYRPAWRTREEISWEVDLLDHLDRNGVRVTPAIRGGDGGPIAGIGAGMDAILAVLFAFADGEKPEPPFPPEVFEREGRAVGRLHTALDHFQSAHHRQSLDLAALLDRPLAHVAPLVSDIPMRQDLIAVAHEVRERIAGLVADGLDWGPCHGDLTFDNLHLTSENEFVWYDFDSGGPGWRALDLQGWSAFDPAWEPLGQAFLAGYRSTRPLSEADVTAAPLLTLAQDVWSLSLDLAYHTDRRDRPAIAASLETAITGLRTRLAVLD